MSESSASPATLGVNEIERFRRGDILLSDEQANRFCDLALSALSETPRKPCDHHWLKCWSAECQEEQRCVRASALSATRFSVMEHVKGLGKGALKKFEYELCAALDYCRRNKP